MPNLKGIDRSLCATSMAARESGEILVGGHGCDEEHFDEWFAQRWSATGVRSQPEALGHLSQPVSIVFLGENEAYVHDS